MGLAFVIVLVLGLSVLLFGGTAVMCLIIWLFTRRRFPLLWPLLLIAPVLVALIPPGLLVARLAWSNLAPPSARFQAVFGQWPDAGIRDLRAQGSGTTDSEEVFLAFRADEASLARFIGPAFKPVDRIEDLVPMPGDDAPPDWWTAKDCAAREVSNARTLPPWDDIVVTRCRTDGRLYVQARWID